MEAASEYRIVRWERRSTSIDLDPTRFLGERSDLPMDARPDDWCVLVLVDGLGEARWTLVAVEPGRETHPHKQEQQVAFRRRVAASAGGGNAPLGRALRRVPHPAESAPPSGPGLTARPVPLTGGEGGEAESATGSFLRSR